jgi:3-methyladenine DNA glycosylase AlkD
MMACKTVTFDEIMQQLEALADPDVRKGQAHFGISAAKPLGITLPKLRALAKGIRDHDLAQRLWATGIHEVRIFASMVDDPKLVTSEQMNVWVKDFDSWDVCDQVCDNLFCHTPYAVDAARAWVSHEEKYVRRAGFVMMTMLAYKQKDLSDELFMEFLDTIQRYSTDERNFVKKAANWALRRIAKRNARLFEAAVATAKELQQSDSSTARWIANDALREFAKSPQNQ